MIRRLSELSASRRSSAVFLALNLALAAALLAFALRGHF